MKNLERPETASEIKIVGEKTSEKSPSPEKMKRYLYTFSYTTPGGSEGSDFEDSRVFFVQADSSDKALEWGKHLSDAYIERVRKDEDANVARGLDWVQTEEELQKEKALPYYTETPVVRYGEEADLYPLLEELQRKFMAKAYEKK